MTPSRTPFSLTARGVPPVLAILSTAWRKAGGAESAPVPAGVPAGEGAGGQLERLQPRAVRGAQQAVALREAVVVEDGLDALLPLAALIDERVTQAHLGAQIEQVIGRDPGLRQPPRHQQLA